MPSVSAHAINQASEQDSQQSFSIPEDFAQRHDLTIHSHIDKLKAAMP
jgi:hypothetical protein